MSYEQAKFVGEVALGLTAGLAIYAGFSTFSVIVFVGTMKLCGIDVDIESRKTNVDVEYQTSLKEREKALTAIIEHYKKTGQLW